MTARLIIYREKNTRGIVNMPLGGLNGIVDAASVVFLPIIFTVFGIALGTKPSKAAKAGVTVFILV